MGATGGQESPPPTYWTTDHRPQAAKYTVLEETERSRVLQFHPATQSSSSSGSGLSRLVVEHGRPELSFSYKERHCDEPPGAAAPPPRIIKPEVHRLAAFITPPAPANYEQPRAPFVPLANIQPAGGPQPPLPERYHPAAVANYLAANDDTGRPTPSAFQVAIPRAQVGSGVPIPPAVTTHQQYFQPAVPAQQALVPARPTAFPAPLQGPQTGTWIQQRIAAGGVAAPRQPNNLKLPKVELPIFTGKISEWPAFREMIGVAIDSNATTDFERQLHLAQHLAPEIKEMMGNLITDPNQYLAGLEYLEASYGGPERLKLSCTAKIRSLPILRDNDFPKLSEFTSILTGVVTTLCDAGFRSQLESTLLLQDPLGKLPPRLRSDWGRYCICQPPGAPNDVVALTQWIQLVHRQEAAAQVILENAAPATGTHKTDQKLKTPNQNQRRGVFVASNQESTPNTESAQPPVFAAFRPQSRQRRNSTGSMPIQLDPSTKPRGPCIKCRANHNAEDCP